MYGTTKRNLPGLLVCLVIAMSTSFLSENYGGPQLLYALLLGLSLHFLYLNEAVKPGIDFCAKTILRLGVAFLGIRITFADISAIGLNTGFMVIVAVAGLEVPPAFVAVYPEDVPAIPLVVQSSLDP